MGMAAMLLARCDKTIKEKKENLIAKGKLKRQAIFAIARKVLVTLNAIVRNRLIENGFIRKEDIEPTNYVKRKMMEKKRSINCDDVLNDFVFQRGKEKEKKKNKIGK